MTQSVYSALFVRIDAITSPMVVTDIEKLVFLSGIETIKPIISKGIAVN